MGSSVPGSGGSDSIVLLDKFPHGDSFSSFTRTPPCCPCSSLVRRSCVLVYRRTAESVLCFPCNVHNCLCFHCTLLCAAHLAGFSGWLGSGFCCHGHLRGPLFCWRMLCGILSASRLKVDIETEWRVLLLSFFSLVKCHSTQTCYTCNIDRQ